MRAVRHLAVICCIAALAALGHAQTVNLTVNPDKVIKPVDERLYGHFLEHIYHSIHGGLWGEVVWNRSFEETFPRPTGRGASSRPSPEIPEGLTEARHWKLVGRANVSAEQERPLNSSRALRIITNAAGGGVGQGPLALRSGDTLRGSLWLRGQAADGVSVRLVNGDTVLAEQSVPAPGAEWTEYPLELTPNASADSATLQIITRGAASGLFLDQVSLMPDSHKATGGFRPDLLAAVADIRPTTIRWPGGSYVGTNGGYRWKGGVGPQSKRVGKVGWDELDPSSFGTDEFIQLCRKVGAEPVIVVYLGSRTPGADHTEQVQEAAEWVEYCNGAATTKWGAVRAANGHPEPYNVKYWEIDNEIWGMDANDYVRVVREFVGAMKQVDPSIKTIACGSGGYGIRFGDADTRPLSGQIRSRDGDSAIIAELSDVVDFLSPHHYENIENYAKGVELAEAYFAKMGEKIAASKNPDFKIYFSEWNVRRGIDWRSGLYAGGILNFMERNKYITMACPALWLRHQSTGESWDNAFINFDHRAWFAAPNYVVMKLYRDHYAPHQIELSGETGGLNAVATKSADGKKVILKLVNPGEQAIDVKLTTSAKPSSASFKLVAPDSLEARNSLEQPDAVKVSEGKLQQDGGEVSFSMPRWSVGVIELSN